MTDQARVLVTGGAGFIGSHIAEACVNRGDKVCVVDDLSTGQKSNLCDGAEFVELDICDGSRLRQLMKDFRPTLISHQAAQTSVSVSTREPVRDARTNVLGTIEVLEAARASQVERIVFASTGGAIYGEVPEGKKAGVHWEAKPKSPYACSKFAAEKYLLAEEKIECRILRYANVYGPRQDPHGEAGVVAIFAKLLLSGRPLQINAKEKTGDDGCDRDYVYVGDVVRANLVAMDGKLSPQILDVGTGIATCTRLLGRTMAEVAECSVQFNEAPPRVGDLALSVLEESSFREIFGAPTGLSQGLKETMEWFRAREQS